MAFVTMTSEQRAKASEKSAEARKARAALLAEITSGVLSLAEVFDRSEEELVKRTRVVLVLLAVPGYGPAKVAALMAVCGVEEKGRVGRLTTQQRDRLVRAVAA